MQMAIAFDSHYVIEQERLASNEMTRPTAPSLAN